MTTAPYIAILAFMTVFLAGHVIIRRRSSEISLGDGGDKILMRRIRTFGNFTEYAPILIAVLMACEFAGLDGWKLHLLGLMIVIGRALHALSFQSYISGALHLKIRSAGMILTLASLILGAVFLIIN